MTLTRESAGSGATASAGFSPKPKPCVMKEHTGSSFSFSPKPKPNVMKEHSVSSNSYSPKPKPASSADLPVAVPGSSPKPKPQVTDRAYRLLSGNHLRMTPFDAYIPSERAQAGIPAGIAREESVSNTKPVAKERMSFFY
jgi:hypothetical protein